MIEFWLAAALLLLFGAALLWFPVARSARKQKVSNSAQALELQVYQSRVGELEAERDRGSIDSARYEQLRTELDRTFLAGQVESSGAQTQGVQSDAEPTSKLGRNGLAIVLTLLVVPGVVALYFDLGSSQVLREMGFQAELSQRLASLPPAARIELLEQELTDRPDNPDLNYLAAREYMGLQDYENARSAYDKLIHLSDGHPDLLAEYAQASFYMEGNKVGVRSLELARLSVAKDPENSTALGLLGIDAFEKKRYREAMGYWQSILEAHPNIGEADALRVGIARARALMGDTSATGSAPADHQKSGGAVNKIDGPQFAVTVALAPGLVDRVNSEDVLFVVARAVSGPPMPLAALRLRAGDLPQEVLLSDAQAMTPSATLSSAQEVFLLARVSKSGTPQSQPGDLEGRVGPIKVNSGQSKINLMIDKVVE